MKVIKSFANEEYELERFTEKNRSHYNARASAIKYFSSLGPFSYFLNNLGLIFTLGLWWLPGYSRFSFGGDGGCLLYVSLKV